MKFETGDELKRQVAKDADNKILSLLRRDRAADGFGYAVDAGERQVFEVGGRG
jgi:hypothetical protein